MGSRARPRVRIPRPPKPELLFARGDAASEIAVGLAERLTAQARSCAQTDTMEVLLAATTSGGAGLIVLRASQVDEDQEIECTGKDEEG